VTPDEIRRAVASLDLDARRALVSRIVAELDSIERTVLGAEWMSFRLRAALSKRTQP
jgi:hypothetical protein